MRAIKYIYLIGMFAVLTFVSCHGPAEQKAVTSQELRELYKEVLTAAISNPDSAMMMIERLRVGELRSGMREPIRCEASSE